MDAFQFDGGPMTARKLRRRITAYSEGALQTALENGCQSVAQVIAFLSAREAATKAKRTADCRKGAMVTKSMFRYARKQA